VCFGKDAEKGVVVEFVFGWREVGGQDVASASVDDQARCYAIRWFLVFHSEVRRARNQLIELYAYNTLRG